MAQAALAARLQAETDIQQALALYQQGNRDEAARICDAILVAAPNHLGALHLLGLLRHQQGRHAEALRLIGAVLDGAPKSADALNDYGIILGALGRREEAIARFDLALAARPDHLNALINRADGLARLGRRQEALAAYEAVRAQDPNHLHALNESGGLELRLGRPQAALACYERALALAPRTVELLINKGTALRAMRNFDAALAAFAEAAAIDPARAEAKYNASLVMLCSGQFAAGWKDYEYRWRKSDWADKQRHFSAPLWLGDRPLQARTILLHAEQGFGDTIQFVRYVALVVQRGARVILEVQPPLKELLHGFGGASQVIARGEALPEFDMHCPLLSLPLAFGTELATVPTDIPYLRPPSQSLAKWQSRVPHDGRLRVGLCWAGSPQHLNDHNRSIPIERFATILSVPDVGFVSVQKDISAAQGATLDRHGVIQLGHLFADFADAAAVIAMLDLIITVDTSVAHLASAMGKATALLVPFAPDFRWLLDRTDSPWYPTMRLFRQSAIGDWDGPLQRLRQELVAVASRRAMPR